MRIRIPILFFGLTSCINTIGWNEFSSRHLTADFYLTSMDNRHHTIVLSTDGTEMNGIVIVQGSVLSVGNNNKFIIAKQCCDFKGENEFRNDTTYYIIDIREFEHKNWFRRKILSDNNYKYETHVYSDSTKFIKALDSLQILNIIKLNSIDEDTK